MARPLRLEFDGATLPCDLPWQCEEIGEIPRSQRYLARPKLKALFEGKLSKARRDALIVRAVQRYRYSQREVADFVDLHYATVSRLAIRP